jgi:hypothetical protein
MRSARCIVQVAAKILYVVNYRYTYNWDLDSDVSVYTSLEDKVMRAFDPKG